MPNPKQTKFLRIRTLKCFQKVYEMILMGFPPSQVARFIQSDRKEITDVKRNSLVAMLYRYRDSLTNTEAIASQMPYYVARKGREFSDRLEELARLERMYRIQEQRVDAEYGHEQMTGVPSLTLDRKMRELTNIVMRMHTIKMDLGLSGSRDLGTMTISAERLAEIEEKYGEKAAKAFANPVSRGRILQALRLTVEKAKMLESRDEPIDVEFETEQADQPGQERADH